MVVFSTMEQIDDFSFEHPRNTIISGPTSSGKSHIMGKILSQAKTLFTPVPSKRILFYREDQPIYNLWIQQGILDEKCEGMPDRVDFLAQLAEYRDSGGCLVFFDDFSSLIEQHKSDFIYYFTIGSHHYNASMFLIIHSLFSPALRLLSLNTHRFILTKSPRDIGQVRTLASQAFPGRTAFVIDAFEDSTAEKYGFLILDFSPNSDTRLRLMGNIFGPGVEKAVYQYKAVVKSASNKMEKSYRKQALIPWLEYQRLKAKASTCNVIQGPSTSDGQNMSNQAKIFIHHDSNSAPHYHGSVPPASSNPDSWQHCSGQSEEVKEGVGTEAGVLSKTCTVPNTIVETRLRPSSVISAEVDAAKDSSLGRVKKLKNRKKVASFHPPVASSISTTVPLPLPGSIPNNSSEPMQESLGQTSDVPLQSVPVPALPSSSDIASIQYTPPVQLLTSSHYPSTVSLQASAPPPGITIPSLPPSNDVMAIDQSPPYPLVQSSNALIPQSTRIPLEYKPSRSIVPQTELSPLEYRPGQNTRIPLEYMASHNVVRQTEPLPLEYKPDTTPSKNTGLRRPKNMNMDEGGSETRKKIPQGPLRAKENMAPLPLDRSYPSSHIRDQDIEPNPAGFSAKGGGRKKKPVRPLVRGSIFRPSPPISNTGRKGINSLGKRKGTHLSRPRPTPPQLRKINRGDKRKPETQGSRGLKKKMLKETDYDLW